MSAGPRGRTALWISGLCVVSGYGLGSERLVRDLGREVAPGAGMDRADSLFQAAALCLLLFLVALVAAIVARVRARKNIASPRTALLANVWLVVSILGFGLVLFLAVVGSIMSIGVG